MTDGRRGPGDDAGLVTGLATLAADEAVRDRVRARSLGRQAAEEGTFAGVLQDLAERGRPVLVHLQSGRRHRGEIVAVGRDFVILRLGTGRETAIAVTAVTGVRTLAEERTTSGDRVASSLVTLAEVLAALVDERARVLVVGLDADQAVTGELRAVGRDVLTVRLDSGGGTAYVALDSVTEISLVESG